MDVDAEKQFLAAELDVERHSAELKKELSLINLVLTQILYIVGMGWIGTAAKLGASHLFFWMAAVVLFYIPSGLVVIHLSREMPLEGGLYQWAKLRFNEFTGFMVAWNLWLYAIVLGAEYGVQIAANLSYALGERGAWIASSKVVIISASILVTLGLMAVALRGLAFGKWIHDLGGILLLVMFAGMAVFAIPEWIR